MNWDAVIRGRLLAGTLGLIALIAIFLIWWKVSGDPGASVGVREVPGVVTEVYDRAYLVHLDSGQQVRVFRTVEVAKGTRVTLRATQYTSGKETLVLMEPGVLAQ